MKNGLAAKSTLVCENVVLEDLCVAVSTEPTSVLLEECAVIPDRTPNMYSELEALDFVSWCRLPRLTQTQRPVSRSISVLSSMNT